MAPRLRGDEKFKSGLMFVINSMISDIGEKKLSAKLRAGGWQIGGTCAGGLASKATGTKRTEENGA